MDMFGLGWDGVFCLEDLREDSTIQGTPTNKDEILFCPIQRDLIRSPRWYTKELLLVTHRSVGHSLFKFMFISLSKPRASVYA